MKCFQLLLLVLFLISCIDKKAPTTIEEEPLNNPELANQQLQAILDTNEVRGALLIYDLQKDQYYSNDFDWAKQGQLPASTFKIPNSIIGLESGVIENEQTIFKWDGAKRNRKIWEEDLVLKDAFHVSCVPCYQEVARKVGMERMNEYVDKLGFGKMDITANNIDEFWLTGKSRISQYQQIDFLKRFHTGQLPISERTEKIMKKLMIVEEKEQYTLRAKTGLSIEEEKYNGWYVGYIKNKDSAHFFATNIIPIGDAEWNDFVKKRITVTFEALHLLKLLDASLH